MQNLAREQIEKHPKIELLRQLIRQCYRQNGSHSKIKDEGIEISEDSDLACPRTFDGFSCWDRTPAGATAYQPCPDFIIGFDPKRFSYKQCMDNGVWFFHPDGDKPWTNYTTCVDIDDLNVCQKTQVQYAVLNLKEYGGDRNWSIIGAAVFLEYGLHINKPPRFWNYFNMKREDICEHFRTIVNEIYVGGYAISVTALVLSLMIFLYFKSLQCMRIRIHMNLFFSFAINNILWIVWYRTVVNNAQVVLENKAWCQILHLVTTYFMVTGYSWMFCEGLHLHISLVVVFVKEDVAMRCFLVVGWGVSLVIVIVYAVVRYYTPGGTDRCWIEQNDAYWIIIVPVVISLIASFVFLINVVRVLLTKLHPTTNQRSSVATRKAARAALILIPLFGLHFVLIPFHPSPDTPGEKVYQVVSALLTSLQGACVAILFCFTNHDVVTTARTHFSRYLQNNDGIPMTGVTGGDSVMNTRENVL